MNTPKLKLRKINHGKSGGDKNAFCGPSALSSLTGHTTGRIARKIASNRKRINGNYKGLTSSQLTKVVKGVQVFELHPILDSFGYSFTCEWLNRHTKLTIREFTRKTVSSNNFYVVASTDHFYAVHKGRIVCNHINTPVSWASDKVFMPRSKPVYIITIVPTLKTLGK